jgi:hypothetical protein
MLHHNKKTPYSKDVFKQDISLRGPVHLELTQTQSMSQSLYYNNPNLVIIEENLSLLSKNDLVSAPK